jgi:hypothetical protein
VFNRNDFLGEIFKFVRLYDSQIKIETSYPTKKQTLPFSILQIVSSQNPAVSNKIKIVNFEFLYLDENKLKTSNFIDSLQNYFEENLSLDTVNFALEDANCTALGCYYDSNISAFVSSLSVFCSLSVK